MIRSLALSSVLIAAMFLGGCSHMTMLRTKELREVQARVDSLHSELSVVQKKLLEEQKTQSEMLRLMRADQQVRFNEVDRKVTAIDANLSENQSRLSRIDEKTAEFQRQLAARLSSDSAAAGGRNAEIEKLFQIAMSDFNAGRYDIAVSGFRDLSTKFPESSLGQEAEYWVAECLYAKKEYGEAEKEYISYIKKYSQAEGSKACVAFYKLGLAYEKQDKVKSKNMVWKKLLEQCPNAQEAQAVKARMGN